MKEKIYNAACGWEGQQMYFTPWILYIEGELDEWNGSVRNERTKEQQTNNVK